MIRMGHRVTVITRLGQEQPYPDGEVVPLGACGREDLGFVRRKMSGLRWRLSDWDWPYFEYYRTAVREAFKQLRDTPEAIVVFNDLQSPQLVRSLLPKAAIFVWLQNEQKTRQRDLGDMRKSTAHWLTCSEYIRDWTRRTHHLAPDTISVVHSGVNLKQFFPRMGYAE